MSKCRKREGKQDKGVGTEDILNKKHMDVFDIVYSLIYLSN